MGEAIGCGVLRASWLERIEQEVWRLGQHAAFYHGGAPGLQIGDLLLPSRQTKIVSGDRGQWTGCEEQKPIVMHSVVYVTPARELALRYAKYFKDRAGVVYRCEPSDDVDICYGQREFAQQMFDNGSYTYEMIVKRLTLPTLGSRTFTCSEARIVEVIGAPWEAPARAWWHADQVPIETPEQTQRKVEDAMLAAGIPAHIVRPSRQQRRAKRRAERARLARTG